MLMSNYITVNTIIITTLLNILKEDRATKKSLSRARQSKPELRQFSPDRFLELYILVSHLLCQMISKERSAVFNFKRI
jgi:hypothetical protein